MPPSTPPPRQPPIPLAYRLLFNYAEPLMAGLGAVQALVAPQSLVRLATPSVPYTPALYPLFPQLAGAWVHLAFHDAVTLRYFRDDRRVWRLVLGATIPSDIAYVASMVLSSISMGAAAPGFRWWNPLDWEGGFAASMLLTLVPLAAKVAFLLGVGLPRTAQQQHHRKRGEAVATTEVGEDEKKRE